VCTSVNEVICHGIPDRRPLADGDIINVDVSVYLDGYNGAGWWSAVGNRCQLSATCDLAPM
jgi:methionine aminopeptidase